MCGICGEIRFDGQPVAADRLRGMNQVLRKRGPDSEGLALHGRVGLGHRRLKIMDLSELSHQPMENEELGLSIVFNGAIYNYRELRDELEAEGYPFRSDGDTEVVLKGYHAWGAELLPRLKGMFALVIWERDSGQVFMARDRFGIKPLYYTLNAQRLRFASSLPALLVERDFDTSIDPQALNYYLNWHAVVPAPHTIVQGIRKLPQGSYARLQPDGQMQVESYWAPSFSRTEEQQRYSFDDWKARVRTSLEAAVKRRMVAAVDVGVLLSGGVDSSLLVGLMKQQGADRLKTYSVGFESVGEEKGDEFIYSDLIARHFGTEHHRISIGSDELREAVPQAIQAMAEPMVSHDCVAFYLLSREVSKTCKVVQSGQGADEVFGGYHWYPPLLGSTDPLTDYRKRFFDRTPEEFRETVTERFVRSDYAGDFVRDYFAKLGAIPAVDKALAIDSHVMLVDDPVKRVDNMTMAWGLEARVPFLDHELVQLVEQVPAKYKVDGGGKYLLKEIAREVIPSEVIDRPKGYFPVPALKYLRGEFLAWVQQALTSETARQRGLFNPRYVDRLLTAPEHHLTPLNGSKLWQLGLLELWLQAHQL